VEGSLGAMRKGGWQKRRQQPSKIVSIAPSNHLTTLNRRQQIGLHHQLERERIHLLLIDEASKGLDDVVAGKVKYALSTIQSIKRRRSA